MSNNTSKSQHLKFYFRLKQQECVIEKSIDAFILNSKVDLEYWHSIKRDIQKFECERSIIADSLKETVINIHNELKLVRTMISVDNVEKIDLGVFKKKLQCLWKKVQDSKNICNKANTLAEEQNYLDTDLSTLMRMIRKHKTFTSVDNFRCKSSLKVQLQKEESTKEYDYDGVEDFCTLLAKTGHTGSWSSEDHLLFVKLRKKCKSIRALVLAIQAKCPDITKESIINHEAWYKIYLELREKQKIAVQEWRKRKESERQLRVLNELELNTGAAVFKPEESLGTSSDHQLKVAEQKKAEIEKKKEMVKQWKEQREAMRLADEERLRNHLRAKKEYREHRRQARAAKMKKLVSEYKSKKSLEKKESPCKRNDLGQNEPPTVSALILQVYRKRDQQYLEKRKNILLSKVNDQNRIVQSYQYDFPKMNESTLFRETKAWQEKCKKIEPKPSHTVYYIKDLPRRSTPISCKSYEVPGLHSNRQR